MTSVADFDFDLPGELIAQEPAATRDESRLLQLDRQTGKVSDHTFRDIVALLQPGDLVVANESRVVPARLLGQLASGAEVELFLVRPNADGSWEAIARPGRKLGPGVTVKLPDGVTGRMVRLRSDGRRDVVFEGAGDFAAWLAHAGRLPVPPYIKKYPDEPERYQTVYSHTEGSIAAPTAGLHFTPELIERLAEKGIQFAMITLHVGPGTFKPVREEALDAITIEAEQAYVSAQTAGLIEATKHDGRRIIAVGTTTTRTLEAVARQSGHMREWSGPVDLFIRPPFEFKVIDGLITNFHLPKSTLLMLVSAFAGRENTLAAYRHVITERYRFYSFGDAMLIQ